MVAPRPTKLDTDFADVPQQFSAAYVAFRQRLRIPFKCMFCGEFPFTAAQSGTLQCSFHPLEHFSRAARETRYVADKPSPCPTCNQQHLAPALRRITDYSTRTGDDGINVTTFVKVETPVDYGTDAIPLNVESTHHSLGCVAIDHCVDVFEFFSQPYVALPLEYLNLLAISNRIDVNRPETAGQFGNWMVVDKGDQLTKKLAISIPYVDVSFVVPMQVVYEAMALKFDLGSLEERIREARVRNNKSSLSQLAHLHHPKADLKDRLHRAELQKVGFAAFIIIARVSQSFVGSKGMRLID